MIFVFWWRKKNKPNSKFEPNLKSPEPFSVLLLTIDFALNLKANPPEFVANRFGHQANRYTKKLEHSVSHHFIKIFDKLPT